MTGDHGADSSEAAAPDADEGPAPPKPDSRRAEMAAALRVIRREGWKAAVVEATVEAAVVFLLVDVLLTVTESGIPTQLAIPVPGSAVAGVAVGLVAFAVGLWLRVRRPLVEQFETVNPAVTEALRTARDAVDDGHDSRMAARLYADVLDRLRTTSSLGLIRFRRVAVMLTLVLALSVAATQAAVYDVTLGGGPEDSELPGDTVSTEFTGLVDGDAVLGDVEDVSAGDANLTARIESTGGDDGTDTSGPFPTSGGGTGGTGEIDSQQAGFDQPELIEDAELIREYNLRIRQGSND